MITAQISENDALYLLTEELKFWTDDRDAIKLYVQMYAHHLACGVYSEGEFNAVSIVANDYIKNCTVIDDSDSNFGKIMEFALYGDFDISREGFGYSYVESINEDKGLILVRY